DMPDNRSRFRLLRCRLKPERQLVLPESKPVRLLPMEVKEVFSYILLFMNFPVCSCVYRGNESSYYDGAHRACEKSRLFPFYMIRIPTMSRFPSQAKIRRKWEL